MPIFKLKKENNSIENAVLIPAEKTSLELEKHLEGWLENSPWAIAQEPLLLIVVWESVEEFTKGDKNKIFSPKDICQIILQKYPNFNKNIVGCQIISDSVNRNRSQVHSSEVQGYFS